ncbi:MAG: hypothetical protein IIB12_03840 [Chloroflexi bacterium]|nr:hypothetical protein [Chloroflexota bacterium]
MNNINCHGCRAAMTIKLWRKTLCPDTGDFHRLTAIEIQALSLRARER